MYVYFYFLLFSFETIIVWIQAGILSTSCSCTLNASYCRDNIRPGTVDHRLHNLTPNRREDKKNRNQNSFETTTQKQVVNRNRFENFDSAGSREDYLTNQPLAKIAFGKLPYPSGNDFSSRSN